ncbi:SAM protein [Emericellopsis cladophorae]|uniref:SAM protein n=1 Tax=Emericellopsis cladophorae TaxID=2686198 RepID=A0A9P9Y1Z2_9HYPO|nr:SAM protein [Emericellopsis cladophorae]KAI6782021.1 SAM protein [Emericellopsis cladophorae]
MPSPPAPAHSAPRPQVGDLLLVIHDFEARGSDELSLSKGDRVELVERDDEFGDGWFMGRQLANGNTGLFPELYTRPAQPALASSSAAPSPLLPLAEDPSEKPTAMVDDRSQPPKSPSTGQGASPLTLPLMSNRPETSETTKSIDLLDKADPPQDSQVLNETLNVINEHITNLRSPGSSNALRTPAMDSGSEYSASIHHRMSYIHGEETDEEEHDTHTRVEVVAWSPDDVAEFLFTSGVEKQHCEVFRDQEISGEVLLGMDQSSLFIKDFDLGSVGRRLKTWHRIKELQDEVGDERTHTRRTTQTYGSDVGSEDAGRTRVRTSTLNSVSSANRRLSSNNAPPMLTPISSNGTADSPTRIGHVKRPSAASIRDMHHSRRHSSTDYQANAPRLSVNGTFPGAEGSHKKQPSFDRNWTLGAAASRPLSQTGMRSVGGPNDGELQDSAVDLDRGYFSGTEVEERPRNFLRKRDSLAHSRNSSYADEQRIRSATAHTRHSRFGSDSYRDSAPQTAAQKYYGTQAGPHRRTASTNTTESLRPLPPAKDAQSPAVTRLESTRGSRGPIPPAKDGDWLSSLAQKPKSKSGGFGIRAISDNLGLDRSKNSTSGDSKDQSLPSPAMTGSSTPSGGPSFDLESPNTTQSPSAGGAPVSRNKGKKGKKETSAYTRGLLNITPKEAMQDADFSGWMRKKSSNLMTTWKPRFFVLKGRRLSYFYSEEDESEKGLIDISFHRVLPADNEKLTGLHASITSAVGGQNSRDKEGLEKGDDSMFIFKLMPPRAGLSRGVHFTKPTVHYFAVPNLKQGRLWMAALMKATIDRDDSQPITTTYQQKTISLTKAKQMRSRPPALMNLDEAAEEDQSAPASTTAATMSSKQDPRGLGPLGGAVPATPELTLGDGGQNGDGAAVPSLQST